MGKSIGVIDIIYRVGIYIALGIIVLILIGLQLGYNSSYGNAKQKDLAEQKKERKQLRYELTGKLEP